MEKNDKYINDKHIIVTNGTGRSGKDTFAKMINKLVSSYKVSSIDFVKELFAPYFNNYLLEQGKTESYRKLLADTKHDIIAFSPCFFANLMLEEIDKFMETDKKILLIDIREPEEISKIKDVAEKKGYKIQTVLVKNDNIHQITSNSADNSVYDYEYDYIVDNSGDLKRLQQSAETLIAALEGEAK